MRDNSVIVTWGICEFPQSQCQKYTRIIINLLTCMAHFDWFILKYYSYLFSTPVLQFVANYITIVERAKKKSNLWRIELYIFFIHVIFCTAEIQIDEDDDDEEENTYRTYHSGSRMADYIWQCKECGYTKKAKVKVCFSYTFFSIYYINSRCTMQGLF